MSETLSPTTWSSSASPRSSSTAARASRADFDRSSWAAPQEAQNGTAESANAITIERMIGPIYIRYDMTLQMNSDIMALMSPPTSQPVPQLRFRWILMAIGLTLLFETLTLVLRV